jgi:hypothetical protein
VSDFPFDWKGRGPLVDVLKQPLKAVSLMLDSHGMVESVAFWSDQAEGVRVHSEMHDLAIKVEVGVLSFEVAHEMEDGEHLIPFASVLTPSKISKLLISESGKVIESGLGLQFSPEQEILVLPSDFPCFLALRVKGINLPHTLPNLEYQLERYEVSAIFIAQGA